MQRGGKPPRLVVMATQAKTVPSVTAQARYGSAPDDDSAILFDRVLPRMGGSGSTRFVVTEKSFKDGLIRIVTEDIQEVSDDLRVLAKRALVKHYGGA